MTPLVIFIGCVRNVWDEVVDLRGCSGDLTAQAIGKYRFGINWRMDSTSKDERPSSRYFCTTFAGISRLVPEDKQLLITVDRRS